MAVPTAAPSPTPNPDANDALPQLTPETFDFMPPLHEILSRLLLPSGGLQAPLAVEASGTNGEISSDGTGHLDIQELGAAANVVKVKIQKARQEVKGLPDVDRSIEEQRDEIEELEDRIEAMKNMLKQLGG
ncbi:hypothetical protein EJ08DRAFT_635195 [Tothia fuscella]|uniref:Mediator of RNA polymerase II transcription subunit 9 n=1 Tax=Tothia fuscella TaxID=1048955 RepID=A0A9P4NQM5_9PEZI|nr:hypothetical protein EJ08DRAFT_635195 [Tothia fuscella]